MRTAKTKFSKETTGLPRNLTVIQGMEELLASFPTSIPVDELVALLQIAFFVQILPSQPA